MRAKTHNFRGADFDLRQPNRFRRAVQVLDLIILDLEHTKFTKVRLALAVVIVAILSSSYPNLIPVVSCEDLKHLNISQAEHALQSVFEHWRTENNDAVLEKIADFCTQTINEKCEFNIC